MTTWTEQDSINLSARLVADDGHHMPLVGAERRAAVERMVAAGLTTKVMADRLCLSLPTLLAWCGQRGIPLPRRQVDWWVLAARPSQSAANQRRSRAAARDRRRAAA